MLTKILVSFAGLSTIGFGIWHFFVPGIYKWYSYIQSGAEELIAAVRATNVFFSLCLVLFGIADLIFVFAGNRFALLIMLCLSCVLWLVRIIMQLKYPQGSINPALQYGMLAAFIIIFLCFAISLILTICTK